MVTQTETIQRLQEQLTAVQFEQQANGASSVGGCIPSQIPASISTGVTQAGQCLAHLPMTLHV